MYLQIVNATINDLTVRAQDSKWEIIIRLPALRPGLLDWLRLRQVYFIIVPVKEMVFKHMIGSNCLNL